MPPSGALPPELAEIRRAAFELRQRDPAEAVKVLRRHVKTKGEFAALAHGALAEILLDEFDDVDAALHHFRQFTELAPQVPAGHQGLARALTRTGDAEGAHAAYEHAFDGLSEQIDVALASEEKEGLEEAVLALLETALEDRRMRAELDVPGPVLEVPVETLENAEKLRLFDIEDDPEDLDDWLRYAALRAELAGIDGAAPALAEVDRVAAFVPLPSAAALRLRSHVFEQHGQATEAADTALKALEADPTLDPEESIRVADLLQSANRTDDAKRTLERAHEALSGALARPLPEEVASELREALKNIKERLSRSTSGPLVSLGRKQSK